VHDDGDGGGGGDDDTRIHLDYSHNPHRPQIYPHSPHHRTSQGGVLDRIALVATARLTDS